MGESAGLGTVVDYSLVMAAGMLTGIFYFGGLWLTVRRLISSRRPALLMLTSFAVRTTLALVLFYVAMDGRWLRLVVSMAGFLIMRQILTWVLGPGSKTARSGLRGAAHHEHHA